MRAYLIGSLLMLAGLEARGAELLVFDWNKPVTKAVHGFPWDQPPKENGDWTTPIDYAGGTLHYRVEIHSQPVAQDMKLQFCFWQQTPSRENCGPLQQVKGNPGTIATWSAAVGSMWKKDGLPIEWTLPRHRNGVAIKDINGNPVSDYAGWNWNGHDPDKWYPLDMRFTVVVVEKGNTFSGWSNYITPSPDAGPPDSATPTPDSATPTPDSATPTPDSATPTPDSATPTPDSVTPTPDSATPTPDSATPTPDSATPTPDSAMPLFDASVGDDAAVAADRGAATELGTSTPDSEQRGHSLEGGSGCRIVNPPGGPVRPLYLPALLVVGLACLRIRRRRSRSMR